MQLDHLRYFAAVARCGSLTAAARQLRISQPALTAAMKQLEERFCTTLLVRMRTGVALTATGQELLRLAAELSVSVEQAEQRIAGLEVDDVGTFVVGCHESLGSYFLPGFMGPFLGGSPRIQLSLWNGTSRAVAQATVDRHVHFGVVVNPEPHPDLVIVKLFADAVDLFVGCDRAPTDLEGALSLLRAGPLVFAGRVAQSQQIIDALAERDALPERLLSCGDLELVKSLALSGLGVAVLPRRVARYWQQGKLRRLHPELPHIDDEIALLFRGDAHRTRAFGKVKDALVAHGRSLDER